MEKDVGEKPISLLEALRKIKPSDLKIKLAPEEEIMMINEIAANKISQVKRISLGGKQIKSSKKERLQIERIAIEKDIAILNVKLRENTKKMKELRKKK